MFTNSCKMISFKKKLKINSPLFIWISLQNLTHFYDQISPCFWLKLNSNLIQLIYWCLWNKIYDTKWVEKLYYIIFKDNMQAKIEDQVSCKMQSCLSALVYLVFTQNILCKRFLLKLPERAFQLVFYWT